MLAEHTNGEWYVLAPYSLGRYGENVKGYNIAKGTVEKKYKEDPDRHWKTACDELREETGIDLNALQRDEYEGVTLVEPTQFPPEPFTHSVQSSHQSQPTSLTMFVIEVKGLEKLKPHFKQKKQLSEAEQARLDQLPAFKDRLAILQTGIVPASITGNEDKRIIKDPLLPVFVEAYNWRQLDYALSDPANHNERGNPIYDRVFAAYEDKKMEKASTREDLDKIFQEFFSESALSPLIAQVRRIRNYFEETGIINDEKGPKLDDKLRWLRRFTEGAEVLPFREYMVRIAEIANQHPLYETAMYDRGYIDLVNGMEKDGESKMDILKQVQKALEERKPLTPEAESKYPYPTVRDAIIDWPTIRPEIERGAGGRSVD